MKKPTLLLFCPVYSSLIRKEAEMFSEEYQVKVFDLRSLNKTGVPFRMLMQFFFLARNSFRCKIMVSRFVGYQTILPILFGKVTGKPVVCILGGLECMKFPSVKTGSYLRPVLGAITKWCLKNATHLCPVHESLILTDYTYQDDDYPKQGYLYFVPDCKTPATVIRNGYDARQWQPSPEKIPDTFVTVAHGLEQDHLFRLKGIDLLLEAAPAFPDCRFTVIGGKKERINRTIPSNVLFTGEIDNAELHALLGNQEFYLQLSVTEGFPNALCEAMLCGCIPIGSDVGAIPEIIHDDRLILKRKDTAQLIEIIRSALSCNRKAAAVKARQRILENYPLEKRKTLFMELFRTLSG